MINLGNMNIADLRLGASQVKAVYFGSEQVWGGEEPVPIGDALCFTAQQNGSTLRLDKGGSPGTIYLETSDDEGATWKDYTWSGNTGAEFTNLNVGNKVYFRAKTENQTIGSSYSNYYKFVMSGQIAASGNIQTLLKADGSRTDAPAYCYSNMFNGCSSLTTAPLLAAETLGTRCYSQMFYHCSSLTTAPEILATTVGTYSCNDMFKYCSSLTTPPTQLPALTLGQWSYNGMFSNCTSLTSAPALPATTLATLCYSYTFEKCTSLTSAPKLPATTLAGQCYNGMFSGCTHLSSIEVPFTAWNPSNATTNWLENVAASGTFTCPAELSDIRDASHIPVGWTVAHPAVAALRFDILADDTTIDLVDDSGTLETPDLEFSVDDGTTWTQWVPGTDYPHEMAGAVVYVRAGATGNTGFADPDHPSQHWHFTSDDLFSASGNIMYLLSRDGSTGLSEGCFLRLFDGCTMLVDASSLELPATTLANSCYEGMFSGCTSLTSAPALPATILADYCYRGMFQSCSSLTTAPSLPATTLARSCYSGMFSGCSSLTTAPELPATTLADSCYISMFQNCTSLTAAPALPAMTLADYCYFQMFINCSSLTTAPELPATTLADNCYHNMFSGCSSLSAAPELSATTLATYCYCYMFNGCSSLTTAPELPATTLAEASYESMFEGCTSLATAPELPATTLANGCYSNMFRNCTSLTDAPALSATTLANRCYYNMFSGCSSLSSVDVAFTAWNPQTATTNWLNNVAASGTFTCPAELSDIRGDSNIPTGWNVVHPSQELSAVCFTAEEANSTVKLYKYNGGAPTLDIETSTDGSTWSAYTQGTVLTAANVGDKVYFRAGSTGNPTMSNTSNTNRFQIIGKMAASGDIQYLLSQDGTTQPTTPWCFNCLFYGQSNLTKAPKCGATSTLQGECYGGTFEQCRGLTEYVDTPLPQMWQDGATNLPHWTYINMFKNCNNLSAIAVNWTSWPMENSSTGANPGWLANVKSTGVFYCPSSLPDKSGEYGIPSGWTRVNI